MKRASFKDWFKELKIKAVAEFGFATAEDFHERAWKDYWSDGYTPEEALREDFTNF